VNETGHGDVFERSRGHLLVLAYRLLGTVADAEDAVQDAAVGWSRTDPSTVENPEAFLVTATTHAALNRLRRRRNNAESYPGAWLPEPIATDPLPDAEVELADSLSMAMLVVLETLSPLERAVFVLHDVFGYRHDEIAQILDRTPAAVRQVATRARRHVQERRPRYDRDLDRRRAATEAFLDACRSGKVDDLLEILAPDAILVSDGGGKASAATKPLHGREAVATFLSRIVAQVPDATARVASLNGEPGFVVADGDQIILAAVLEIDAGLVKELRFVRNPDKLGHVRHPPWPLGSS